MHVVTTPTILSLSRTSTDATALLQLIITSSHPSPPDHFSFVIALLSAAVSTPQLPSCTDLLRAPCENHIVISVRLIIDQCQGPFPFSLLCYSPSHCSAVWTLSLSPVMHVRSCCRAFLSEPPKPCTAQIRNLLTAWGIFVELMVFLWGEIKLNTGYFVTLVWSNSSTACPLESRHDKKIHGLFTLNVTNFLFWVTNRNHL